jgi:hypothetical protein
VPVNITNTKYGYHINITSIIPQAPYKDVATAIPGKVEVENYDVGGSGKAYLDKDDDNKGGEYRDDAVDIVKAGDGYAIGYTQEGEWLEYTVKVAKSGEYDVSANCATTSENAGFKLYVDGNAVTDNIIVSQGTSFDTYTVLEAGKVTLSEGEHVLKVEIVGNYVNIDWLNFADPSTTAIAARGLQTESLQFAQKPTAYSVFDMQGRLVAKFIALSAQELQAKTAAAVKRSGTYLVKPQTGRQMHRVTVK